MNRITVTNIRSGLLLAAFSVLFTVCVIPGFRLIGALFYQVAVTSLLALTLTFVADRINLKPVITARALTSMTVFWTAAAIYTQIAEHIRTNDRAFYWIINFYYDRIAMIFVVWASSILYYIIKVIINSKNKEQINDYSQFSQSAFPAVFSFYIITFIYCFFICRIGKIRDEPTALAPFETFKNTFLSGYFDYELIFLFMGNIAMFIPIGIFFYTVFKKKKLLHFVLPTLLSISIEIFQYIFKMGYFEFDDILLNSIGGWLGVGIISLLDLLMKKASKGRISTLIVLRKYS